MEKKWRQIQTGTRVWFTAAFPFHISTSYNAYIIMLPKLCKYSLQSVGRNIKFWTLLHPKWLIFLRESIASKSGPRKRQVTMRHSFALLNIYCGWNFGEFSSCIQIILGERYPSFTSQIHVFSQNCTRHILGFDRGLWRGGGGQIEVIFGRGHQMFTDGKWQYHQEAEAVSIKISKAYRV